MTIERNWRRQSLLTSTKRIVFSTFISTISRSRVRALIGEECLH